MINTYYSALLKNEPDMITYLWFVNFLLIFTLENIYHQAISMIPTFYRGFLCVIMTSL